MADNSNISASKGRSFMRMRDEGEFRALRKAARLNAPFEEGGKIGKYQLPLSNKIPTQFAMETTLLPHSQIRTQDFQLMPLIEQEPTVSADVKEIIYTGALLRVPVLRSRGTFETKDICKMMFSYLVPFMTNTVSYPYDAYLLSAISLFASLDGNLTTGTLNKVLAEKDIKVELVETYDYPAYWAQFPHYGIVTWTQAATAIGARLTSAEATMAFTGVVLQTMGKQVNDQNGDKWFNNRLKALFNILNVEGRDALDDYRPSVSALSKGNNTLSTAFYLRRVLIDRMFKFKTGSNRLAVMFAHVLQLLSCTDITHVMTIDTYVTKSLPEIMNLPILRQYENNLLAMYQFWDKYKNIFPYVRFYVPQEECTAIHRDNLMPLTAGAFAVGTYMSDSFQYYKGPVKDSSLYKKIHTEVTAYLDKRMQFATTGLTVSERATMTDVERERMLGSWYEGNPTEVYLSTVRDIDGLEKDIEEAKL